jgi:Radical SAM proteins, N-terminal
MSRRLQERHARLREAEVFLEDVPQHGSFRVALVWPNLYFVGMSNLGFQAVYRLLNRTPDVVCERAFLPDDEDTAELERTSSPLVSFESGTPLRDFDAVAFSSRSRTTTCTCSRCCGWPASRCARATAARATRS